MSRHAFVVIGVKFHPFLAKLQGYLSPLYPPVSYGGDKKATWLEEKSAARQARLGKVKPFGLPSEVFLRRVVDDVGIYSADISLPLSSDEESLQPQGVEDLLRALRRAGAYDGPLAIFGFDAPKFVKTLPGLGAQVAEEHRPPVDLWYNNTSCVRDPYEMLVEAGDRSDIAFPEFLRFAGVDDIVTGTGDDCAESLCDAARAIVQKFSLHRRYTGPSNSVKPENL